MRSRIRDLADKNSTIYISKDALTSLSKTVGDWWKGSHPVLNPALDSINKKIRIYCTEEPRVQKLLLKGARVVDFHKLCIIRGRASLYLCFKTPLGVERWYWITSKPKGSYEEQR